MSFAYRKGIWLVVSSRIGCVHLWESRRWGVLTVALGGKGEYKQRREAGVVVTSTQHAWWQWSKWGHDTTFIVQRTLSYNLHMYTVKWYYITIGILQYSTNTSTYSDLSPKLGACQEWWLFASTWCMSWVNDNKYCVCFSCGDKVCLDLFSREWVAVVRLLRAQWINLLILFVSPSNECVFIRRGKNSVEIPISH